MRINKPKPQEDAPDEWIVTYSDMVTLLLAFFVLLFAFSTVDATKWKKVVESFTGEIYIIESDNSSSILEGDLGIVDKSEPPVIEDVSEVDNATNQKIQENFNELYDALVQCNMQNGMQMQVMMDGPEIRIRLSNHLLFASARANLNNKARATLTEIMLIVRKYDSILRKVILEGNTDNLPIHNEQFRDNFELSLERALTVLYFFKYEGDFSPQKLVPLGYGEFNPIADNDTVAGRAKNRRTDIVLVKVT